MFQVIEIKLGKKYGISIKFETKAESILELVWWKENQEGSFQVIEYL